MRRSGCLLAGVALLVAACAPWGADATATQSASPGPGMPLASEPSGPALSGPEATDTDADGTFRLVLRSAHDRYRAGQEIEAAAILTYLGPDEEIVAFGSGSGLIVFAVESRETSVVIGPAFTGAARRTG